jgi:hypothetical protein
VLILPAPLSDRSLPADVSGAPAMVEDNAMRAREFDDDAGHPDGYVINIAGSHSTTAAACGHVAA